MLRNKTLYLVRRFFFKFNNAPIIRQLGIFLYKFGQSKAIKIFLEECPEISAVYSQTFFNKHFVLGESDIDLHIVTKDMPIESEISVIQRFENAKNKITKRFPFVQYPTLYFADQAAWREKYGGSYIEKKANKSWSNMTLLYGQEIRTKFYREEIVNGQYLRVCYEEILLDLYTCHITGKKYFRNLYYNALCIIRSFYISQNGLDATSDDEYYSFLIKNNVDENFCKIFFNLPKNKFEADEDALITIFFNIIKIIEATGKSINQEESVDFKCDQALLNETSITNEAKEFINSLDKTGISSIYLTNSLMGVDFDYLYLFIDSIAFKDFRAILINLLDKIQIIKTMIEKMPAISRIEMFFSPPTFFPIIITGGMLNFYEFINGPGFLESYNLATSGRLIYGNKQKIIPRTRKSYFSHLYFLNYKVYNNPENIMTLRILKEHDVIVINNIRDEYDNYFGKINCDLINEDQLYIFNRSLMREILN